MNRLIFIIPFFLIFKGYSQDSIIGIDSIIKEKSIILESSKVKKEILSDTIILNLKSEKIILPISQEKSTRIILIKEKTKVDWLKYILPLITLLLGIWIRERLEKRTLKRNTEKNGQRWIAELRSLEEPLNQQIESLEKFAEEHKKEVFKIPSLQVFSSLNGEVFKALDKNDLIKYIESHNKNKAFSEIVKISGSTNGFISILIHQYETLQEKFNKYLTGISTHTSSLNIGLQDFRSAFRDYGVELEKEMDSNPLNDPRYQPIAELYSAHIMPFITGGNFNPFVLQREFFQPLVGILADLRLDERTKKLSHSMTACLNAIKGIEMEKHYMTENINTILERYKQQQSKLNNVVNDIA
ncbi:hypothetical protein G1L02_12665 [Tenacibaculum finnmarkense]|uniref:hypothetical protein n=1 Tax=Tenacibaculum finnmarkense TaxID=2781243 RepID=UPI001EFB4A79|nr:hypothetical protein [Tenacibaculum finnmarkense]MCG8884004.1 hypothetical protein [Tenacibaculum finnmarkense]